MLSTSSSYVIGNVFDKCRNGIKLDSSTYITVKYNEFVSTVYNADIVELNSADNNIIMYNSPHNKYSIIVVGANTTVKYNRYYVTENSGTVTFNGDGSTTQFTIAHNLVSTPSKVQVTPMSADASGDYYVTVDSSNIYVNYKTAPPSGTDNIKLSWYAEV